MKKAEKREQMLNLMKKGVIIKLLDLKEEEAFRQLCETYCFDISERDDTGYENGNPVYPVYVSFSEMSLSGKIDYVGFLGYEERKENVISLEYLTKLLEEK